jgi:FeS assembly SUF system regulator
MVRLTNLADYAVVIMVQAAQGADGSRLSAAAVADVTGIPLPTVAKIAGLLSRAGLLATQRGAGGGFRLARESTRISVADIVEAVDGPIALTQCVPLAAEPRSQAAVCSLETICAMRQPWQVINRTVRDALANVSLADLARVAVPPVVETRALAAE